MGGSIQGDEPIYQQLHQALRGLLGSGEFPIGSKFLSERQIADRFEVSRPTANKVLAGLMAERLLAYKKGVGTFVQEPVLSYDLRDLVSFTEKAKAAGKQPSTRVLEFQSLAASSLDDKIFTALGLAQQDQVFYIERLRLADDTAMIYEQRHVVAKHCPKLKADEVTGSLYGLWTEQYHLHVAGADQRIRAISADKQLSETLGVALGDACFQVTCTGYLANAEALWWEQTCYRGDAYELISRLGNQDDGQPVHGAIF